MISDIWSGYNEPQNHQVDLFYEIKEVPKVREEGDNMLQKYQTSKQENIPVKPSLFQAFSALQPQRSGDLTQADKIAKAEKSTEPRTENCSAEKSDPFAAADYFDTIKRSGSLSRHSEKSNNDARSNVSSGFSFNEKDNKGNSQISNRPNDQSIKILYNQLNQQFPDESKFTSQLVKAGQALSIGGAIKHIPVKRKI